MKKKKYKEESDGAFYALRRKIRDFFYDCSCWFHNAIHGKKKNNFSGKKNRGNLQRNTFLTCILAIPVLNFIIYYIIVNFNSILMAFQMYDLNTGDYVFLTKENGGIFSNFIQFITDLSGDYTLSFATKNSFTLYFIGLFVSMPIQIFTAFFIYKKIPGTKIFKVLLYLPQILSSIVMTIIFRYFADQAIPEIIHSMGFAKPNFFSPDNVFTTILVYNIWFGMGGGLIIYTGAMSRIPDEIIEYGQLEGLTMVKEMYYVTLPLIFPTISVYLVTGIAGIFTNQGNMYTFFGENADATLYTYGYYLFVQVIGNNATLAKYPYASAAGLLFTFIAAPITLLVKYLLEKFGPSAEF